MLEQKLEQLASEIRRKKVEEKINQIKEKEKPMPYGVGTYGSKRGRPPKSAKIKKQSAVAIAKKKKMKKKK